MQDALELTTRFSAITTSPKARAGGLTPTKAAAAGAAHLHYIERPRAALERAWAGMVDPKTGIATSSPEEARAILKERMRDRADVGRQNGARVAEKMIVSLPNGWPAAARQEALERIVGHLAPAGSEAMAYAVTHRDKSHNRHLHVLAVDGLESVEAARARRPEAKRVRRGQVIRLGDLGRPRELRVEIAGILNRIAEARGLPGVEWRSFKARGITHEATAHEGPRRRAIAEKQGTPTPRAQDNARRRQERLGGALDALESFFTAGGTILDLRALEPAPVAPKGPDQAPADHEAARAAAERAREQRRTEARQQDRPERERDDPER